MSLLPTPVAQDTGRSPAHHLAMRTATGHSSVSSLAVAISLLPTPAARLADKRGMPSVDTATARMYDEGRRNLEDAIALLPTPMARDGEGRGEGGQGYWGRRRDEQGRSNGLPLGAVVSLLPTPTAGDGAAGPGNTGREGSPNLRTEVTLLPTPRATDGTNGGPNQRGSSGDLMPPSAVMLPTPTVADSRGTRNATASRATPPAGAHADRWGQYAPAIARWEQILGRPAPDPTEPGAKGQPRLSSRFVEWLMGVPDGWVTDVPGLSRNEQLRALGNGVVPPQGAMAVRYLLAIVRDYV